MEIGQREDYDNGVVTDSVDSSYTYSFNIDNSSFELRFPQDADKPTQDPDNNKTNAPKEDTDK